MLLKIPDFLKTSLNMYEIYLHEFWFQNNKQFQSYKPSNFDFPFLYTKMSLFIAFSSKNACNFTSDEYFAAKNLSETLYILMKK